MNLRKVYALALALVKSQLRAARSGRVAASFFRRPQIILYLDFIAFAIAAGVGYVAATFIAALDAPGAGSASIQLYSTVGTALQEGLLFIPAFIPAAVLIPALLFELNVSSKFSASDTVNWLPVTQYEYVVASVLSVAYNYSLVPFILLGVTLPLALAFGYAGIWVACAVFSLFTLVMGATFVEILRAAINRVSSIVFRRARRGALLFRLVVIVVIIVVFDTIFNPDVLLDVAQALKGSFSVLEFVPIFWGSAAIAGIEDGDALAGVGFSAGVILFTAALFWVAVRVRSRYWSPVALTLRVTSSEYVPRPSFLTRLGLSPEEAAIVRKDFRGLTRRRELLSYLAIPVVFVFIFLIDEFSAGGTPAGQGILADFPAWFGGALFALLISGISFGQESKSVLVLYSLPVSAKDILKAKLFLAIVLALTATLATFAFFSLIERPSLGVLLENLAVAVSVTVEEVFLGLAFGVSHPDFQERPRPRFVDPFWLLLMTLGGIVLAFVTAIPILLRDLFEAVPGAVVVPFYLYPASVVLALVVTILCYRWSELSVVKLMAEYSV